MCDTPHCRKPRHTSKHCHSCLKRRYSERHPERYAFTVLRNNARRRGKDFELTFEQFMEFAVRTDYMAGRGRLRESLHVDRIDETKGYTADNIQVLTNAQNLRKYLTYSHDENGKPCDFRILKSPEMSGEDYPF